MHVFKLMLRPTIFEPSLRHTCLFVDVGSVTQIPAGQGSTWHLHIPKSAATSTAPGT